VHNNTYAILMTANQTPVNSDMTCHRLLLVDTFRRHCCWHCSNTALILCWFSDKCRSWVGWGQAHGCGSL